MHADSDIGYVFCRGVRRIVGVACKGKKYESMGGMTGSHGTVGKYGEIIDRRHCILPVLQNTRCRVALHSPPDPTPYDRV